MNFPPLEIILKKYGLSAKKSLGQNFLHDSYYTNQIVNFANIKAGDIVLEVGGGPACLTRLLVQSGAEQVVVIERDDIAIKILSDLADISGNLEVIHDDAMKIIAQGLPHKNIKVVANLPYNISTELLFLWLQHVDNYSSFTLMFQKEVAKRICASYGSKAYGKISVITQTICEVSEVLEVPPEAFLPPPKVTSTVVHMVKRAKPLYDDISHLGKICTQIFANRRKMIRKTLQSMGISHPDIDETKRPEELSLNEIYLIADIAKK